ncbi:beta-N-acetylhexosaminidase [Tenacibaculum halocynthiae]|uniref:beta-N-acetylhexosaminidase n=1 Tax=Tenacibaculum halocynthiae TaxID=1254437 RepID=UPI003892DC71
MIKRIINNLLTILLFSVIMVNGQNKLSETYNLMPWPKEIKENNNKVYINEDFTVSINNKEGRVHGAAIKFIRRLTNRTGVFVKEGFPFLNKKNATIKITFNKVADIQLNVDESYEVLVTGKQVEILAKTDVGAIRGLETVLQLIRYNENSFYVGGVTIKDSPRFIWRGLMIDVARHYQPLSVLKRNLDAMASMKMNVFHWHLSDDQGFRVESKVFPKLHELGSDGQYYTHENIKDIVSYANKLGIRVVPEIDVPGHATAILTAYPELGSKKGYDYKIERFSGVFHPTLNPINPEVYVFLDKLFAEITPLFPDNYFHIGGDENEGKHWDENHEVQKFKKKEGLNSNHDLQTFFNIKLQEILKKYNKKLMGWDEIMTKDMPKTAIIHSWRGVNEGFKNGTLTEAVKNGYQAVLSNDYYIDRMQSVEHHYLFDPAGNGKLTKEEEKRVLGGEVTMWSELVTSLTIDSRIWPRTAAIAERFWSVKEVKNLENMRKRLRPISLQLEELGISHFKNRDVILRNITKSNDISSLKVLTGVYEPVEIYTRNKGGTEYKSFSPFTLFADACFADAIDGYNFKKTMNSYLKRPSVSKKKELINYFNKWIKGYNDFLKLQSNPNTGLIKNHYKKLKELSLVCVEVLNGKKITKKVKKEVNECVKVLKEPLVDTELVVLPVIEKFLNE